MADKDPTSQSNYLDIFTEHVAFEWAIDFKAHNIKGYALHDLRSRKDGVTEVMYAVQ
jgi:leukotriene-A4 hydrolase